MLKLSGAGPQLPLTTWASLMTMAEEEDGGVRAGRPLPLSDDESSGITREGKIW